jgi:hypothetical protein
MKQLVATRLIVALLAVAGNTLTGVANTVHEHSAQATAPWTCVAHVQPLQASGTAMHANGLQTCSGTPTWKMQRIEVSIQKHRFLGVWTTVETVDSGSTADDSVQRTVFYDCRKDGGKATFRARILGYAANNSSRSNETLSTNEIDMDCVTGIGHSFNAQ